jgi:leucyl-tRNA synthetase
MRYIMAYVKVMAPSSLATIPKNPIMNTMKKYNPSEIEPKWQQTWADTKLYAAVDLDHSRPKYYMLTEFPYPSGDGLHAGHAREYTLGDVISRHKRMLGYNVLYPMGYDAFGLPTENYAIKHKVKPQDATAANIATFRKQFDSLGYSFDWDREVLTTDPVRRRRDRLYG